MIYYANTTSGFSITQQETIAAVVSRSYIANTALQTHKTHNKKRYNSNKRATHRTHRIYTQTHKNNETLTPHGVRVSISIGISFVYGKKIVFRITIAKLRYFVDYRNVFFNFCRK